MAAPEGKLSFQRTEELILHCSSCKQFSQQENSKLYIPLKFFLGDIFWLSLA